MVSDMVQDGCCGSCMGDLLSQFLSALLSLFMGIKKFEILHLHRTDFKNLKKAMSRHLIQTELFNLIMRIGIIVLRHPIVRLFLTKPAHTIYHYSDMYLTVVAPFYFILGLLAVYCTTIQSMQNGRAPFIACIIELVMRLTATLGLSGIIGYTSVCIASPLAWFGACAFLIPCYYIMIRKTS